MGTELPYKPKNTPLKETVQFDGANFVTSIWQVPSDVEFKGKIIYVHGFAEKSEFYVELFDKLSNLGYEVFYFDQRGAGETSPGSETGKTNEEHVRKDLDFFIKKNLDESKNKDEKFFLLGHSMGGGIALSYGIDGTYVRNIRGILVSAPLVKLHPKTEPNIVLTTLAPFISSILPNLKFDSQLKLDHITSNEDWKRYLDNKEKLVGTARQFNDMFARGRKLRQKDFVSQWNENIPVSIIHGTTDYINWIKGSQEFYGLLDDSVEKQFHTIEGARHSLFMENEVIFSEVLRRVVDFLESH